MKPREKLVEELHAAIEYKRSQLDGWKQKLDDNPFYAFQWSRDAVEAAATIKVLTEVASLVTTATPEKIEAWVTERALLVVAHPPESTSPFANEAERYAGKAYSDALERWIPRIKRALTEVEDAEEVTA